MKRFVLGVDRVQSTLLPGCLDDFIDESNPVRAIDAFVDALEDSAALLDHRMFQVPAQIAMHDGAGEAHHKMRA